MTTTQAKATAMTDRKILRNAIIDSFWKLDPRLMVKNPVMFVVEVGALITLVVLLGNIVRHTGGYWFGLQITLWLWFTVLFANFAEAMAEGRGKAQAETLRKARAETDARKLRAD
jgi:K+-transporting ATPase ATPase B chain